MTEPTGAPSRPSGLRGLAAASLAAALLAVPGDAPAQQGRGIVVAADTASEAVSVLESRCWGERARLEVGGEVHQVAPAPGGGRVFVAHGLSGPPEPLDARKRPEAAAAAADDEPGGRGGAVTVVDLQEGRASARFRLGRTGDVTDVWSGHDGSRVWVAVEREGRVLTLDSRSGELLMEWTIGRTSAQSGDVTGDGRHLFVTNREAGTLTVIDRLTVAANTVTLDRGAGAVSADPSAEAWVADRDDDRVWVVDGPAGEVATEMPSGGRRPVAVRHRPGTDEVWVLHRDGGGVQVFDAYRRERTGGVELPGRPRGMRFSADGEHAIVTVPGRGLVVTVDAAGREVESTARVPLSPGALAWADCSGGGCGVAGSTRAVGPGTGGEHGSPAADGRTCGD